MGGLQAGQPMGLLHIRVDNILQFLQWLSHYMDIMDVQKDQLSILICIFALVTPARGLEGKGSEVYG